MFNLANDKQKTDSSKDVHREEENVKETLDNEIDDEHLHNYKTDL